MTLRKWRNENLKVEKKTFFKKMKIHSDKHPSIYTEEGGQGRNDSINTGSTPSPLKR